MLKKFSKRWNKIFFNINVWKYFQVCLINCITCDELPGPIAPLLIMRSVNKMRNSSLSLFWNFMHPMCKLLKTPPAEIINQSLLKVIERNVYEVWLSCNFTKKKIWINYMFISIFKAPKCRINIHNSCQYILDIKTSNLSFYKPF